MSHQRLIRSIMDSKDDSSIPLPTDGTGATIIIAKEPLKSSYDNALDRPAISLIFLHDGVLRFQESKSEWSHIQGRSRRNLGTGPQRYDFNENFRSDGKRWDMGIGGAAEWNDMEIEEYFAASTTYDDEVAGKLRGGKHSEDFIQNAILGNVDQRNGNTRLRTEDAHPNGYETVGTGSAGVGLSTLCWICFCLQK